MLGIQVLTFEISQPRKRTPIRVIYAILRAINRTVFWEVQLAFLLLTTLYTFTRSECPCPKTAGGRDQYDSSAHFNVQDFDPSGMPGIKVKGMWMGVCPRRQAGQSRLSLGVGRVPNLPRGSRGTPARSVEASDRSYWKE